MLPENAKKVLIQNLSFCFENRYDENSGEFIVLDKAKDYFNNTFGVKDKDSAFIGYYSVVAFPPLGIGAELLTLNDIEDYAQSSDSNSELSQNKSFFQISTGEGEGAYWFNATTDAVYDVNWGEEEAVNPGNKEPKFSTFYDFLQWYYS